MAKKAYVNDGTDWIELASATTDLTAYQQKVTGVSDTEIGYLDGVTSAIQTQLNSKLSSSTASSTYAALSGAGFTGEVYATKFLASSVGGDEGGEIFLGPALTNTTLAGGITIDVWQNRLRIFEQGGNARGAFLDIASLANGVASQIALTSNTTYVGTTAIALNRSSATQTLSGVNLSSGASIGSLTITSATIDSTGNIAISPNLTTSTLDLNSAVRMNDVYNKTSSSGANMLIATTPLGYLYRSTASSQRWKNSIEDLSGELDASKLLDLPVHQFKFNNDYLSEDDQRYDMFVPGFIAEEVADIYPIAAEKDEDGLPSDWNSRLLLPPMLKLIQDQANKINELELRIMDIEGVINNG